MLFGIDSTFLTRALDADLFVPYEAAGLDAGRRRAAPRPRAPRHARSTTATCASTTTRRGSRSTACRCRRASTTSSTRPTRTSSSSRTRPPRRRAWRSCWPPSRPSARTAGRRGGATCAPTACRSSTGGRRPTTASFSGGGASEGTRPLVVSYASSPPAEVLYADPPIDESPVGRDRRELLPPGRGGRASSPAPSTRRRPGSSSTSCSRTPCRTTCPCRCSCSRCAATSPLPDAVRRARRPARRTCTSCRRRTSARTGRSGSTGGPISWSADPPAVGRRRCSRAPRRVPRRLLRLAGRQHRRRGAAQRRRAGTSPAWARCSATPSCARSPGSRSGRRPPRRRSPLRRRAARAPRCSPATSSAGGGSSRRSWSCPSCCRRSWWGRPSSPCSDRGSPIGVDLQGTRRRSCSPTPSSTWPWWCARSAGCGRGSTRARRRRPASSGPPGGGPSSEVTRPALRPAIASAAAITFLFTFTSFGVVRLLGGGRRTHPRGRDLPADGGPAEPPGRRRCSPCCSSSRSAAMLVVQDRLERRRARRGGRAGARRGGAARDRSASGRGSGATWPSWPLFLGLPLVTLVERSFRTGDGHGLSGLAGPGGHGPGLAAVRVAARGGRQLAAVRRRSPPCSPWCWAGWRPPRWPARGGRVAADRRRPAPRARSAPRRSPSASGSSSRSTSPVDLRASPWLVPDRPGGHRAAVRRAHDDARCCARSTPAPRGGRRARRVAGPRLASRRPARWCGRAVLVAAAFAFAISLGEFGATTVIARADAPTVPVAIARLLGRPGALNAGQALRPQHRPHGAHRRRRAAGRPLAPAGRRLAGAGCDPAARAGRAPRCGSADAIALAEVDLARRAGRGRGDPRARAAAGSRPCCARSPACSRSTPARCAIDGVDHDAARRRTGAASASCSRTTRCSRTSTWRPTWPSGSACRAGRPASIGAPGRGAARPRRAPGHRRRGPIQTLSGRRAAAGGPGPSRWRPSRGCCCSTSRSGALDRPAARAAGRRAPGAVPPPRADRGRRHPRPAGGLRARRPARGAWTPGGCSRRARRRRCGARRPRRGWRACSGSPTSAPATVEPGGCARRGATSARRRAGGGRPRAPGRGAPGPRRADRGHRGRPHLRRAPARGSAWPCAGAPELALDLPGRGRRGPGGRGAACASGSRPTPSQPLAGLSRCRARGRMSGARRSWPLRCARPPPVPALRCRPPLPCSADTSPPSSSRSSPACAVFVAPALAQDGETRPPPSRRRPPRRRPPRRPPSETTTTTMPPDPTDPGGGERPARGARARRARHRARARRATTGEYGIQAGPHRAPAAPGGRGRGGHARDDLQEGQAARRRPRGRARRAWRASITGLATDERAAVRRVEAPGGSSRPAPRRPWCAGSPTTSAPSWPPTTRTSSPSRRPCSGPCSTPTTRPCASTWPPSAR